MLLVDQDESEHVLKDIALLLVNALRDWPTDNRNDIAKCIAEFKAYFGDPFTFVNGRISNIVPAPDWTWRGEAGAALTEMIELSIQHLQLANFDAIVDRVLGYYEQKFLLSSKQKPFSTVGYAQFELWTNDLTRVDYLHWLGLEPDRFSGAETKGWSIRTSMTVNINAYTLVKKIVKRLTPIKDRLTSLKQAHPDLNAELNLTVWSSNSLALQLEPETLQFLGEISVQLSIEMFAI